MYCGFGNIYLLYKAEKPSVCLHFLVGSISRSCVHGSTSDLLETIALSSGMTKFILKGFWGLWFFNTSARWMPVSVQTAIGHSDRGLGCCMFIYWFAGFLSRVRIRLAGFFDLWVRFLWHGCVRRLGVRLCGACPGLHGGAGTLASMMQCPR